jgi:hypothetical protein
VLLLLPFETHGRARLDPVGGHISAPTGPCEPGVHDGVRSLQPVACLRTPHLLYRGGIRGGLYDILGMRVQCAIPPIPLLFAVVLWYGTASPPSLGGPAYSSICNLVQVLYGD